LFDNDNKSTFNLKVNQHIACRIIRSSVAGFEKGDEVFGTVKDNMKEGALGEYVAVSHSLLWKKPAGINFLQAASILTVGVAALMTIQKMGKITASTSILINGAAGGFGMFLLQLLKMKGAHITAVTGTNATSFAKAWGANSVIDYKKEDVLTQGTTYDVVVDLSGKMRYRNARRIMKPQAVFINPIPNPVDIVTNPIKNLFRGKKHIVLLSAPSERYVNELLNAIDKGLQIEVTKVFPFAQSKEAYQYAENGGTVGKVVIEVI
jgi:NADPH:quinone reductase-like Zn-dependent oxidoreductase